MAKEQTKDSAEESTVNQWNYDEILQRIGQLGKFQLICFIFFNVPIFFAGFLVMSYIFVGATPEYRCRVQGCENATTTIFYPDWLNNTMPFESTKEVVAEPSRCLVYNNTWENVEKCWEKPEDTKVTECSSWVYDTSIFPSTIVTEFDLTCDNEWKQTFAGTVYMFGMLVGSLVFGPLPDWIGRKYAFLLMTVWCGIFASGSAFAPNYYTYAVLRFFTAMGGITFFLTLFVWSVEMVGPKYRVVCGFVLQIIFTFGNVALGGIAYFVRQWRQLQFIVGAPYLLFLLFWFMPESPRWLITKGRYAEARQIIQKAAKMNKKQVPVDLLLTTTETTNEKDHDGQAGMSMLQKKTLEDRSGKTSGSLLDVFRNFVLFKRAIVVFSAWTAATLGYYGLSMAASTLAGDFYINYELSMLVETPAYVLGIFVMDKVGRRPALTGSLLLGGVSCVAAGMVPEDPATILITLSLIGKLSISLVHAVVYSYTAELFPTPVRSAVVGMCSTCGRIGSIFAPFIASTGRTDPAVPYVIFGIVALVSGLLSFLLPETRGCDLPETIKEAEDLEKKTLAWTRSCNRTKP